MDNAKEIFLECTCSNITNDTWEKLMQGATPISYKKLLKVIKTYLPYLYDALSLNLPNPYADQAQQTPTHYILLHSAIEYFINKGE